MKQNWPSLTAYRVAMLRAAHQILDNPRVFEDPMALRIVGPEGDSEIHSDPQRFETRLRRYLRAIVVARSRFVEDELSLAVEQGVRQYVILGAGLDTFAYRNPHSDVGLSVFEVDYPATQEWKHQRLGETNIHIPETLTFVPVDFENQSLADQLVEFGFRTNEPSFFSWLGVTMYLTYESMKWTLESISALTPSDSTVVFDYVIPSSSQNVFRRLVFALLSKKVGSFGEPFKTFYDPTSLITRLQAIGYTPAEDIGPEEINARYFRGRVDGLMVGNYGHLMKVHI